MKDRKIYIIGAGISGLTAAFELEKAGYSPVILEEADEIGGRLRTDKVDGFLLDRGFQVLLTSYPEAHRYLDYEALDLEIFQPGAVVLKPGDAFIAYDPLRKPLKMLSMAFSEVGSLFDKVRMYQLVQTLKEKHEEEIFSDPEVTTLAYLKRKGFSDKIIDNFFRPFFRGIFLEEELETSSRMFEFLFKMLATGYAAVPAKGMGEIPRQLASKLTSTSIRLKTKVDHIVHNVIHLASGDTITADDILLTIRPHGLVSGFEEQDPGYRKVTNLYYSLLRSFIAKPMVGLVPGDQFLVNNLVFMTDISKRYSENGRALLSVSIVKDVSGVEDLESHVALELEALSGVKAEHFQHIKTYSIPRALPISTNLKYAKPRIHHQLYDHLFLAGDYLLNGSINAAMNAGRSAAEAIVNKGF